MLYRKLSLILRSGTACKKEQAVPNSRFKSHLGVANIYLNSLKRLARPKGLSGMIDINVLIFPTRSNRPLNSLEQFSECPTLSWLRPGAPANRKVTSLPISLQRLCFCLLFIKCQRASSAHSVLINFALPPSDFYSFLVDRQAVPGLEDWYPECQSAAWCTCLLMDWGSAGNGQRVSRGRSTVLDRAIGSRGC